MKSSPPSPRFGAACCTALILLMLSGVAAATPAEEYDRLYKAHDFFSLKAALTRGADTETARFYRAAVLSAFNQPAASDRVIDALLREQTDTGMTAELLEMRLENARRLSDYPTALKSARRLMDIYTETGDDHKRKDVQNTVRLLSAIEDVPPQTVIHHGGSLVKLSPNEGPGPCIPVTIGTEHPCYILDTGANYSVLIRSEATRLGLKIIPAGVEVGSSTDAKVVADMAVAPVLTLGPLEYHNVIFLVMPDAVFTLKEFTIRGILGYQVFEGMGAVTTRIGRSIEIPKELPDTPKDNIVLDGRDILTQVQANGHDLICRLDTGADRTVFYKPYYDRYKASVETAGTLREVKTAGAGGVRHYKAYTLPQLELKVAGHRVSLHKVNVYTESVVSKDYLMCNLGQDVLKHFKSHTIDLRSMSLDLD